MPTSRLLAVKLADIGDVLLTTPALRRLRDAFPNARLDYLTTANGALALRGSTLVDEVIVFDKYGYDRLADAARPQALLGALRFGLELRARRYDAVLLFHHYVLPFGALKFNALLLATGAPRRVGLDNGRGWALTDRVPDEGFGVVHEVEYALRLAEALVRKTAGGRRQAEGTVVRSADFSRRQAAGRGVQQDAAPTPVGARRLDFPIPPKAHEAAEGLLAGLGEGPRVALFPGSGGYSLARRWPPASFAYVADALQQRGAQVILVGREGDNTREVRAAMQTRPALDLTDQGDLQTLGAVLARMDLLLTNDGGPMHIATAVGTPVVAVFGLSNDRAYGPWASGAPPRLWPPRSDAPPTASPHTVVKLGLGCQPCFYRGLGLGAPQGCPTRECLTLLPVELVLQATLARLSELKVEG